ncbi:unnamed protein product [Cunninghamella blakesleeana]
MDTKKFEDFVIGKLGYETTIVPTQRDIDIVRYSWEKVVDLQLPEDEESVSPAQAFGLAFYNALFELDPSVRALFGTNVFTQAKMLSGVLAFITRVPFIKHQPNNNSDIKYNNNKNNNKNNNNKNDNNKNDSDINDQDHSSSDDDDDNDDDDNDDDDDDSTLNEKPTSITKVYTIREINAMKREQEEKENHFNHSHHQIINNNHHHPCQYIEKKSNNIVNNHHHSKNKVHNNNMNHNDKTHHKNQHHHSLSNKKNPPISHSRSSSSRSISSKLKSHKKENYDEDLDVDPNLLIEKLQDLGARHFYYNVKPEQFKLIGPAIDAALKKRLGDEYTKEVKDAWSITHAYAAHHMSVGLRSQQQYEKKKSNSLKNSSNNNCIIQ